MDKKGFPALCGGTFFTLLLEAAKPELKERKKWSESREFAETDVFEALMNVVVNYKRPTDDKNFGSAVSAYKSCNRKKSGRLPITQQANIATFDESIKKNYQKPLSGMVSLVNQYIDADGKGVWLVKALLDLIDQGIDESAEFYVSANGRSMSKVDLCSGSDFYLPSLLLGIWHYVIVNKIDNASGKDTYDEWCKPGRSSNTREPFQSDIGDGVSQTICLLDEIDGTAIEDKPFVEYGEPFEDAPQQEPQPNFITQTINAPAVFFNSGANVMQINNTGIMNIDRSGKT
jgi:hypothetical protein